MIERGRRDAGSGTIETFGRAPTIAGFLAITMLCATPTAAARLTILAIGDSNTAGDGVGPGFAWPALVEKMLRAKGYDAVLHNDGVSGDTTAEALARLDRILARNAQAAIVFLGRNDKRFDVPKARTSANIEAIVTRLQERGLKVLLVGFAGYDFSGIAARTGALYHPDFFAAVSRNGRKLRRFTLPFDLFRHLNARGQEKVAADLLPEVEKLLQAVAATPPR